MIDHREVILEKLPSARERIAQMAGNGGGRSNGDPSGVLAPPGALPPMTTSPGGALDASDVGAATYIGVSQGALMGLTAMQPFMVGR
jgi:hypothetical protein